MYVLTKEDALYPAKLKAYRNAPRVLYCEGNVELLNTPAIAIIGTREPTQDGKEQAFLYASEFAARGVTIVSGLAIGVDTEAHRGALDQLGNTIAVLGSPLHDIYPKENRELAARIAKEGLLITEYSDSKYAPWRFKERDYVQAAISEAVLPIQGWKGSGTRHACKAICELRRQLYIPTPRLEDKKRYPDKYELLDLLWQRGDVTAMLDEVDSVWDTVATLVKLNY